MPNETRIGGLSGYRIMADALGEIPYTVVDLLAVPWALNYPYLGEHVGGAFRIGERLVFMLGHPMTPGRVYFMCADSGVLRLPREPGCSFVVPADTGLIHNTPNVWVDAFRTRQFAIRLVE